MRLHEVAEQAATYEWRKSRAHRGRPNIVLFRNGEYSAEFAFKIWPSTDYPTKGNWTYSSTKITGVTNRSDDKDNVAHFGSSGVGFDTFEQLNAYIVKIGRPPIDSFRDYLETDDAMDITFVTWTEYVEAVPYQVLDVIKSKSKTQYSFVDNIPNMLRKIDQRVAPQDKQKLYDYFNK